MGIFITNILLIILIAVVIHYGDRVLRQMGEQKALDKELRSVTAKQSEKIH